MWMVTSLSRKSVGNLYNLYTACLGVIVSHSNSSVTVCRSVHLRRVQKVKMVLQLCTHGHLLDFFLISLLLWTPLMADMSWNSEPTANDNEQEVVQSKLAQQVEM